MMPILTTNKISPPSSCTIGRILVSNNSLIIATASLSFDESSEVSEMKNIYIFCDTIAN